ncbi:Predicted membrane protein [Evansella caseinilytica]|uniref:Predicted membrane protein n=1 Tax=Evansella caseinilytica TaxID=1503961 RepID=A0A1H3HFL2_9BACI|nr:DUF2339 domain-containing protein [Evansella caseinilytica]SDY14015.1 Predicted membrane protein [Evansella caseinilytica]
MDKFRERLQQMTKVQGNLAKDLEAVLEEYESHDLIQENRELQEKYQEIAKKIEQLKAKESRLQSENTKLRVALQEQILDEKLSIIKLSKEKITTYFQSKMTPHKNALKEVENGLLREINRLQKTASNELQSKEQSVNVQLEQLSAEINLKIKEHRENLAKQETELLKGIHDQYELLAAEEVSEKVMQKRMKQNEIEMKIGLNWINKIGILLIILGVGAAFRYSYLHWFNDYVKGALFFALGLLMLGGGEWLYRKQKQIFALGLLGGGIAVLYGSVFFCYFLLGIIGLYPALLLSVAVTVTAVVLSLRYESKTICSFGLIGGYLPLYSYILAFGMEGYAVYAAMGYVLLLNLSILWISFRKCWDVVKYLSFTFYIPSMFVLIGLSASDLVSMVFSIVSFLLYLGMTIGYSFKHKVAMKDWDVVLLGLNTFISCSTLYYLFNELAWNDFRGLLAVIFCLVYFALGKWIEQMMPNEKQTKVLFYGTSLTFAILTIPFQFALEWIAIGWLIEAAVFMIYGNLARQKAVEKAGWGIFALCLAAFLIEVYGNVFFVWSVSPHFNFKYTSIMVVMLAVLIHYSLEQQKPGGSVVAFRLYKNFLPHFKYGVIVNVWIYLLYEGDYFYHKWIPDSFPLFTFYQFMLYAFVTIALAYGLTKVPLLYDRVVKYFCLSLYGIGSFLGLIVTMTMPALQPQLGQNTALEYFALVLLIAFNVIIFFTGRDILIVFIRQQYKNLELYPLILAVYLLAVMAAFVNVQLQLGDVGFVFSIVYLLMAIGYILYGFKKKFVYVRRLGLGVTLFSTGKLILYDLSFLTEGSKIIAYFVFGVALLGISYMYQKVSSMQDNDSENEAQI